MEAKDGDRFICRYCLRYVEDCGGNCAGEADKLGLSMEAAAGRLRRMAQLTLIELPDA